MPHTAPTISAALGRSSGQLALHESHQPRADLLGLFLTGSLDHDPHKRLGAAWTHEHSSTPGESLMLDLYGLRDQLGAGEGAPIGDAHVDELLGQLAHRVSFAEVTPSERFEREQRSRDPVAGAVEAHLDDVPGLLSSERPSLATQFLEHVAISDIGAGDLDAGVAHGGVEAVVGHHRHDNPIAGKTPVLAQVERGERYELIAVDHLTGAVYGEHTVAVPVERKAEGVSAIANRLSERRDVGGAAAVVDVAPVGCGGHNRDVGAEAPEYLWSDLVGSAVGAVEQHVQSLEAKIGKACLELSQVVLMSSAQLAHPPDRTFRDSAGSGIAFRNTGREDTPGGGSCPQLRFDRELLLIAELETVGGKELDTVVVVGIV